ncbi:MAG: tetraacyldisaccharide 4'-kinase [Alphaproteobacteria bacterium]|nr:tetraacyldisaccharide 4'-kinase [Alphaproteobacteria bacterium]
MPLKSPKFWQKKNTFLGKVLSPLGRIYAWGLRRKLKKTKPYRSKIPVVCIGNLVMGGVGKTPLAVSVAEYFKMNGMRPVFLTRGYGGGLSNVLVDLDKHTAKDTGDEALLLARIAPTIVDADRARGAKTAEKIGADVVIMDDGFQNPQLVKDLSFAVFDGRYGFGNGKVFPAGPLREPVEDGLQRADAFIVVGKDKAGIKEWIDKRFMSLPFIGTHIEQDVAKIAQLSGKKVFAFAGIGYPDKFFDMLRDYGCDVVETQAFSDHYPYTDEDMTDLIARADKLEAVLVTTAKDGVRIAPRFLPQVQIVEAYMVWDTPDAMCALLSALHKK